MLLSQGFIKLTSPWSSQKIERHARTTGHHTRENKWYVILLHNGVARKLYDKNYLHNALFYDNGWQCHVPAASHYAQRDKKAASPIQTDWRPVFHVPIKVHVLTLGPSRRNPSLQVNWQVAEYGKSISREHFSGLMDPCCSWNPPRHLMAVKE